MFSLLLLVVLASHCCSAQSPIHLKFLQEKLNAAKVVRTEANQLAYAESMQDSMDNMANFLSSPKKDWPIVQQVIGNLSAVYQQNVWMRLSEACRTDLQDIPLYNQSVIAFLDSQSKIPPGAFSQFNLFWDGNYKGCMKIDIPRAKRASLRGQYCWVDRSLDNNVNKSRYHLSDGSYLDYLNQSLANITQNTCKPLDPADPFSSIRLKYAICVPEMCTNEDVLLITKMVTLLNSDKVCDVVCKERQLDISHDANAIACIVFLGLLVVLLIVGTAVDVIDQKTKDYDALSPDDNRPAKSKNPCIKFLVAFSAYSNGPKIFSLEKKPGQIDSVHGIRFFSMTWVVLGHSYMYLTLNGDSFVTLGDLIKGFFEQVIVNATVSVDTFFLLSGLLVSYLFLKNTEKTKGTQLKTPMFWIKYYLHRYIRLTPPVAIVMWANVALMRYMANGPYWAQTEDPFCHKSWWTNLLYVNNLVYPNEACYGIVWYLANDMQFYIFAPLALIPMFLLPIAGTLIAFAFIIVSMAVNAYLVVSRHYPPTSVVTVEPADYFQEMYVAPWIRWGPYVLGLLLGQLMIRLKKPPKIPMIVNLSVWLLSVAVAMAILFGMYPYYNGWSFPTWEAALYSATNRVVWSACVGWVIFGCFYGYGGVIDSFLSWHFWFPFSRLSYSAYLVHWFVLPFYFTLQDRALHFDTHLQMFGSAWAVTMFTYLVAIPVSLTMEMPIITLDQMLFGLFLNNKRPKKVGPVNGTKSVAETQPKSVAQLESAAVISEERVISDAKVRL